MTIFTFLGMTSQPRIVVQTNLQQKLPHLLIPAFCLAALLCLIGPTLAAADVDPHIERVSAQIKADRDNAALWLQRGRLQMEAERWPEAQKDLRRAYELEPRLTSTLLFLARIQMEVGKPQMGLDQVETYLASLTETQNGARYQGEMLKGDLLKALGRLGPAAEAYGRGLALAPRPQVEHVLAHAELLTDLGRFDEAIQTLDSSAERLRSPQSVQLRALEILEQEGQIQEAVQRAERLALQSKSAIFWWVTLGDLHRRADAPKPAAEAYGKALAAMADLPAGRRGIPAMVELEAKATEGLRQIPKESLEEELEQP